MNENGHRIGNWVLFGVAALFTVGLGTWFTFAFFRKEWDVNDVSLEVVLLGLGAISAYAGHNKFFKTRCGTNGRAKPGEWIFGLLMAWAVVMLTLYQTKALSHWKEMKELVMPEQFIFFLGAVIAIFTGTRAWDIFFSTRDNHKK
ncbi:MAG: hypothetical protein WAP23_02695 [Candidatus Spechtbacterales bacterium]